MGVITFARPFHVSAAGRSLCSPLVPRVGVSTRRMALQGILRPFGGVSACFAVNPYARRLRCLKRLLFHPGLLCSLIPLLILRRLRRSGRT